MSKTKTHKEIIDEFIKVDGFRMTKQIQQGYSTFFNYHPAVYDEKIAYSIKEIGKLVRDGFSAKDDVGIILWNALTKY